MRNNYLGEIGKAAWKELEHITTFGYSNGTVFSDFLDVILNSLLSLSDNMGKENLLEKLTNNKLEGKYEDRYMELVKKYKENESAEIGKRPADYFTQAWAKLYLETLEKNEDVLGEIYMNCVSLGEHGQFFTPTHVTDMMAAILNIQQESVCDPCCGSGRMLLSASKNNPNGYFYGTDLDSRCAKMAAINLWIFNLNGQIVHGDSLTGKRYTAWEVLKGGYIFEHDNLPDVIFKAPIEDRPLNQVDKGMQMQLI